MLNKPIPIWKNIHTIIFDFDGVFTDNKVLTDQHGNESVICDRSDGLAFNMLKNFAIKNNWDLEYFILSTEINPVVRRRAEKLKLTCNNGINSKTDFVKQYLINRFGNASESNSGVIYLGNDLNDYNVMKLIGFPICPNDAHPLIKSICNLVLEKRGGNGCVREFIEKLLVQDQIDNQSLIDLI